MVKNVAPLMADLEDEDFFLLSGIEHGMRFSEWVDRRKLPKYAELDANEVDYRLDRCQQRELVKRKTIQYEGYQLLYEGYDALALRTFSKRGTINGVGTTLGEGKESDVLEVIGEIPLALKFHREGITNFRRVDRGRDYTSDHEHVSWLYTARKAAEREYELLSKLYPDAAVPEPIDHNRHAIIMERLVGVELAKSKIAQDLAGPILTEILQEIARIYELGYIHTDASEFNIILTSDSIYLIDWPQAVATSHPNAEEFLARDVTNVVSFFHRKYPQLFQESPDLQQLISHVRQNSVEEWATINYK